MPTATSFSSSSPPDAPRWRVEGFAIVSDDDRISHEVTPDRSGRLRIVVSAHADGIERRDDGWWWSPPRVPVADMLARVLPDGGAIGVPGGRGVFDIFLAYGYDAFHLTRARGVALPGGTPLFSDCLTGRAEAVLARHGLAPGPETILDPDWAITQTVFRPRRPRRRG